MQMVEDFKSETYKNLVQTELLKVFELCEDFSKVAWDPILLNKSFDMATNLHQQMRKIMKADRLDRHKLASIVIISIIWHSPIIHTSDKRREVEWKLNEILAINVAEQILHKYSYVSFCKRTKELDELNQNSKNYFKSISYPPSSKDELSVRECFINAISYLRTDILIIKKQIKNEIELARLPLLVLSHLYFYMELYNWNSWIAMSKGEALEPMLS